uniref:Pyridine nucleotide-disulphide oxidoreductase N-terminal domain-containing protein n=1 Tax=Hucho hucho TaxID=62062 RepID=A0A4W5JEK2_9TELE
MEQTRLPCGQHDYDLLVIVGGLEEAAGFGRRVLVLDLVAPTPKGTKLGLGGSSVNVGSIPRNLLHQASLLGKAIQDARKYSWKFEEQGESWRGSGASVTVRDMYLGHQRTYHTAETLIIAMGDREQYLIIVGDREHCFTSDDLFSGSNEGLECAGFLSGLGLEVTVVMRSHLLPGFGHKMAQKIKNHLLVQRGQVPPSLHTY